MKLSTSLFAVAMAQYDYDDFTTTTEEVQTTPLSFDPSVSSPPFRFFADSKIDDIYHLILVILQFDIFNNVSYRRKLSNMPKNTQKHSQVSQIATNVSRCQQIAFFIYIFKVFIHYQKSATKLNFNGPFKQI
jgi:hypothetical protein